MGMKELDLLMLLKEEDGVVYIGGGGFMVVPVVVRLTLFGCVFCTLDRSICLLKKGKLRKKSKLSSFSSFILLSFCSLGEICNIII